MNPRLAADAALVLIAFIWGATFVVVKRALPDVSPTLFLAIRFAFAAVLLAIAFRGRWWPPRQRLWWTLSRCAAVGAFLIAGYILQTLGLEHTTSAKAGFITGFYIPLVPFLSILVITQGRFAAHWPKPIEALGILIATLGVILMTLPDERLNVSRGDLLVLASTFAYAVQIILIGRWSGKIPFESLAVLQIAISAVLAAALFPLVDSPPRLAVTTPVIFAVLISAIFATALAFGLQSWAQQHTTPTRTALIFALEPLFAWVTAWLADGEKLSGQAVLGGVAILAGVLLVELKPSVVNAHPTSGADVYTKK